MGRCDQSTATSAGVGEARGQLQVRQPAIFHANTGNVPAEWHQRLSHAAGLGVDYVCLNPFLTQPGSPLLVRDLGQPSPDLGVAGTTEEAIRAMAKKCKQEGLRLCLDIVLDRLAADGPSARSAGHLFQHHHQSDVVDPRLDRAQTEAALVGSDADGLSSWWAAHLVRLADAGADAFRLLGLSFLPDGALRALIAATRREAACAF